jgi:hypothetical protein
MKKKLRPKSAPSPAFLEEIRKVTEQLYAEGVLEIVGYRDGQPVYQHVDRRAPTKAATD